MTPDERKLLRELGYRPPAQTHGASAATETSPAPAADDPPPFGLKEIEELLRAFEQQPEAVLKRAREAFDPDLTEDQLRQGLVDAQAALRAPKETVTTLKAAKAQWLLANRLPDNFTFPLRTDEIPIEPSSWRFETIRDFLGWAVLCGPFVVDSTLITKAPFRWHSDPSYASSFIYPLPEVPSQDALRVALFSDFGTGEYHSLYIARALERHAYPYAIHLGDVYYAGRQSEFEQNFDRPLEALLSTTKLFALNANHEMYSGGWPYFASLARRRTSHANQEQEGSYFVLRSTRYQIIGIDTAYFGHGRYSQPDLSSWLEWVLRDGRSNGRLNILLSGDEPYCYGKKNPTQLHEDLRRLADDRLIDLWFWGNTHYCALFDRSELYPFVGSCIGHAGYPYSRQYRGRTEPAPVLFLETAARFPAWTKVRQDRGNNGYCLLELCEDPLVRLRYIDWMGNDRCVADVRGTAGERLEIKVTVLP